MFACKDLLFTSPDLTLLGLIGVLFLIYPFEFAFIYHLTKKSRVRVITAQQVVQLVMVFSAAWLLGVDRVHDVVIFILAAKAISLAGGLFTTMWRLFSIWIVLTQIYWLPDSDSRDDGCQVLRLCGFCASCFLEFT